MDLTTIADSLERFADVGVVGYSILFVALLITGQIYTKGRVEEIKANCQDRIDELKADLADERRSDLRDERRENRRSTR